MTFTVPPLAPSEALLGASVLRRQGIPTLAFWDSDRQRWRFAVCWDKQRVERFDTFEEAVTSGGGFVRPYPLPDDPEGGA